MLSEERHKLYDVAEQPDSLREVPPDVDIMSTNFKQYTELHL